VPDVTGRLPGRGIYVTSDPAMITKAAQKGLFSRAARSPVTAPDALAAQVEAVLTRRVLDLLSLGRKAGQAVTGYEKVREWLVKGQAIALIQASDGSERCKAKLRPPERKNGFIGCLTSAEMGLAFGREHAIHAALAAGGLGQRVVDEAARLAGFREQAGGTTADEDRQDA
jgi:ribosomal protein L7Ae-like RNA K-turn-binding protein